MKTRVLIPLLFAFASWITSATALRYTVSVRDVAISEILIALAEDAKQNLNMPTGLDMRLTLHARDQPLAAILESIARETGLIIHSDNGTIRVMRDLPELKTYQVDYLSLNRQMKGNVSLSTAVGSTGSSDTALQDGNSSLTQLQTNGDHQFWSKLEKALLSLLGVTGQNAASVSENSTPSNPSRLVLHPETGVIAALVNLQEHRRLQRFIDEINANARRQVLIDAAVVEIELKDEYQAGVNWSAALGNGRMILSQATLGNRLPLAPFGMAQLDTGDLGGVLKMLESFGKTRVLSNPRVMAINNQSAVLKVVDEKVYFSTRLDVRDATERTPERRVYSSEVRTVPVGLVMSVTPQISKTGDVMLHIRPTVSRITGYRDDPAMALQQAESAGSAQTLHNQIPEIQVREIESVMNLSDGETAILGGLVQNRTVENQDRVPGTANLPFGLSRLFASRDKQENRTELLIILRTRITQSSINWPDIPDAAP